MNNLQTDWAHRRILVVGGGQSDSSSESLVGNGRAICLALARAGATVACADVRLASARQTADMAQGLPGRVMALQADVTEPDAVKRMVGAAHEQMGGLDGLVLNVGISDRRALPDVSAASWDAIFEVNLRGHMLCAQAALPLMQAGGAIVFMSSMAARLPLGRNPAYEASKAALGALCRATALEGHAADIRANVVLAGLIDTPMGRAASAARPGRASGALPFGRQGSAWDIAHAVCFLLSEEASYINAVELPVDGGLGAGIARPAPAGEAR